MTADQAVMGLGAVLAGHPMQMADALAYAAAIEPANSPAQFALAKISQDVAFGWNYVASGNAGGFTQIPPAGAVG
jgi:hypothetical protein